MQKPIKIDYCPYKWKDVKDPKQKDFCSRCQKQIPDLSSAANYNIGNAYEQVECGNFHVRHLEEGTTRFHFINRLENKFQSYGWLRLSAVVLPLYFFIISCGHKKHLHRKGGKLLNDKMKQKEQFSAPKSVKIDQNLAKK